MKLQKRVLVIGSNSFSGSHCINALINRGNLILGISRSEEPNDIFLPYRWGSTANKDTGKDLENYSFEQIDLNKDLNRLEKLIKLFRPEVVINFASQGMVAQSWDNPTHWYQTNIVSQVKLHEILRQISSLEKYVHISTPEVYGSTNNCWVNESQGLNPSTPYAVSRAACDLHLMSFYKAYKFPVVFTRAANVYGPGQQLYRIIPRTILSAITGKKMYLHGGGASRRSFIHIKDVISATLRISDKAIPGSTWHISSKHAISIKDIVDLIFRKLKVDMSGIVKNSEENLGKDMDYLLSSEKIRRELEWQETISLEDGIEETIKWVMENIESMKCLPWKYIHKP